MNLIGSKIDKINPSITFPLFINSGYFCASVICTSFFTLFLDAIFTIYYFCHVKDVISTVVSVAGSGEECNDCMTEYLNEMVSLCLIWIQDNVV